MKIYYIANTKTKTRLLRRFNQKSTAHRECNRRNKKSPGHWMWGDWVDHSEFGINKPYEWPWQEDV